MKKNLIKETKSEMKKVIWPTPKEISLGTVAVITISLIVAAFIFVADTASLAAVEFITSKF